MKDQAAVVPQKRQRIQKQPAQRKRGRLSSFTNLPLEIFNVIASYLLPPDVLSLARTNKMLRGLLMTESSRNIWLSAIRNAEGMPRCPAGMSEPRYVALLFTNVCSACGTIARSQVDEYLLVRLCGACKDDELHKLPEEVQSLVPYSMKGMGAYGRLPELELYRMIGTARRGEANTIWDQYNELVEDDDVDDEAFEAWIQKCKRRVAKRLRYGQELSKFLIALEAKRNEERRVFLQNREDQIKEKLLAAGWKEGDLKCNPYSGMRAMQWHELVENPKQPKPLTDRVWKNLYTKLVPLLEENRAERLQLERAQLQLNRRYRLGRFLRQIELQEPPLLKVKPRQTKYRDPSLTYRPLVQRDVFPYIHDAFDLSFIEDMDENEDLSIEAFQKGLEEHRNEIDTFIAEWRDERRTHLVNLLREENMEYPELLQPPKNIDPEAFARLSDDQKLLLRADSLFYVAGSYSYDLKGPEPSSYDEALRAAYPSLPEFPTESWELEEYDPEFHMPDFDAIHRDAAAQGVARALLWDLGKPNASYLEMNQLRYTCERCHDKKPRGWIGIIIHYLVERKNYSRVQKHMSELAQKRIVYHDAHGANGKPMVRVSKPKESVKVPVRQCSLCIYEPIAQRIVASKSNLYKHLLEVHDVAKPQLNVHYQVRDSPIIEDQPGAGYDYEDGDESEEIEDVEADNSPGVGDADMEYIHVVGGGPYDESEDEDEEDVEDENEDEGYIIDDSE